MLTNVFYYLMKVLNKIVGLPFNFSHDGEDFILLKYLSGIKNGNYIDITTLLMINALNYY